MKELDEEEVEVVEVDADVVDRNDEELVVDDFGEMSWNVKIPMTAPITMIPSIAMTATVLESDFFDIV